ncbi:PRTRC genetic system ThiF family protein [Taibaiella chishuiensis]|uniref:PRTRC genetic system ThiF family protein n=2 Tax=Taibaiella chishuiensis TaxID=1434707 RepID=A0A2P8D0W0_9BACT|nr:PRTRC genetic system ThiF family protein [Taibaiella chishuiensis]
MHFVHHYLINPTNPVKVNLIGAGGTGSYMIMELSKINLAMLKLGHPGLQVTMWDGDIVTEVNTSRQLFAESEIGLNKAVAKINAANRSRGTNWKAIQQPFKNNHLPFLPENGANIYISCVDKIKSRFEIARILKKLAVQNLQSRDRPLYWIDMGNAKDTGQVFLSTVTEIRQPDSKLYQTVSNLPFITVEFKDMLRSMSDDNEPSCSHEDSLKKQGLHINSAVAKFGASLLTDMFREGMTQYRGIYLNLSTYTSQPVKVA